MAQHAALRPTAACDISARGRVDATGVGRRRQRQENAELRRNGAEGDHVRQNLWPRTGRGGDGGGHVRGREHVRTSWPRRRQDLHETNAGTVGRVHDARPAEGDQRDPQRRVVDGRHSRRAAGADGRERFRHAELRRLLGGRHEVRAILRDRGQRMDGGQQWRRVAAPPVVLELRGGHRPRHDTGDRGLRRAVPHRVPLRLVVRPGRVLQISRRHGAAVTAAAVAQTVDDARVRSGLDQHDVGAVLRDLPVTASAYLVALYSICNTYRNQSPATTPTRTRVFSPRSN